MFVLLYLYIAAGQADSEEVRRGADEYAASVLIGLEGDVVRTLQSIKKGIALLDERRAMLRIAEGEDAPGDADAEPYEAGEADGAAQATRY